MSFVLCPLSFHCPLSFRARNSKLETRNFAERGAALIIAVLILTILLFVALSYVAMSQQDLRMATNIEHATQASLLTNAGTAIGISFLQHDLAVHPTVTSLDHAWKTYFNGAWAVAKPWTWKNGIDPTVQRGVAEVDLDALLTVLPDDPGDALYIPRLEANGPAEYPDGIDNNNNGLIDELGEVTFDPSANPLVVTADYMEDIGFAPEQIHRWADVDNDEDGLRDSAWIPIPQDRLFPNDGLDNDLDGMTDERPDDLIDNDADGIADGVDTNADGTLDVLDPNETVEKGTFIYWGGDDELDNDGDGVRDEADEQRVFLTAPITVDLNGDGVPDPLPSISVVRQTPGGPQNITLDPNRGSNDIDRIDNDWDLVTNDSAGFAYIGPDYGNWLPYDNWTAADRIQFRDQRKLAYNEINVQAYFPGLFGGNAQLRITATGEPACDVVGRVAVLITDETSKVNLNTAGALTYNEFLTTPQEGPVRRALGLGISPHEYDTRVLPDIGVALSTYLWDYVTGSPVGFGFAPDDDLRDDPPFQALSAEDQALVYDASFPGYGRVDENGSALWLAMNGLDDDGDGLIDEGIFDGGPTASAAVQTIYRAFINTRGFEGIDEPEEFQQYLPLRNAVAETNTTNDNLAEEPEYPVLNEIGELGDRVYKTREQIKQVNQIGPARYGLNKNLISVHSSDKNERHEYFKTRQDGNRIPLPAVDTTVNRGVFPSVKGLKLDYNYASAEDITRALITDWDYRPTPYLLVGSQSTVLNDTEDASMFYRGLRREDLIALNTPFGIPVVVNGIIVRYDFAADPELRAGQLAANVRDNRDPNQARTLLTNTIPDRWWDNALAAANLGAQNRQISYTIAGLESIRINEIMVRPVRRVEAEMSMNAAETRFYGNFFSVLSTADFSLVRRFLDPNLNDVVGWQGELTNSIGDRSYFFTNDVLVDATPGDPTDPLQPNIIQFRFGPGPGLPPGRYYLMFNSMQLNASGVLQPTVTNPNQIRYAIKTAIAGDDIITDIGNGADPWLQTAQIGYENMAAPALGTESGFVFLPTRASPGADPEYDPWEAFTVSIPTYKTANQDYLYVAIQMTAPGVGADGSISINFFDFSQEPDHEWVELVNVARTGEPVDLSGWQLEVGGDVNAAGRVLATIPNGTQIAPGGSILLGVNKYDPGVGNFGVLEGTMHPTYINGIGLARIGLNPNDLPVASLMRALSMVTAPPIPMETLMPTGKFRRITEDDDVDNDGDGLIDEGADNADNDGDGFTDELDEDDGGSVFAATRDVDFVDRDGDGLADTDSGAVDDYDIRSTNEASAFSGTAVNADPRKKAWDRIVQLDVNLPVDPTGPSATIGRLVLGGGIFPNYPEHDRIDNDQDALALATDKIDNNGDGVWDAPTDPNEGVDEGRFWQDNRYGGANFESAGDGIPGGFSRFPVPTRYGEGANWREISANDFAYLGSGSDAPDWKEFVERRLYPGDNVVVTLYQGPAFLNRVADRVTYTERDVINRAIDDILPCDLDFDNTLDRIPLDTRYPSFWPDNTMGVDFYRALERKHPLYAGDRFGVSNRWQATDGNYDDWSPSTSRFERILDAATGQMLSAPPGAIARTDSNYGRALFGHAFEGSPLRINLSQRWLENPKRQLQPLPNPPTAQFANDAVGNVFEGALRWAFYVAGTRDTAYASPGNLAALAHYGDLHAFATFNGTLTFPQFDFLHDMIPINESIVPAGINDPSLFVREDVSPREVLLGQNFTQDLAAVTSLAAESPTVLSVAQAETFAVYPPQNPVIRDAYFGGGTSFVAFTQWDAPANIYPRAWSPIILYALPGDTTTLYQLNYLFGTPDVDGATGGIQLARGVDLGADPGWVARWTPPQRATMFVSGNLPGFDPLSSPRYLLAPPTGPPYPQLPPTSDPTYLTLAAESLFVWEGADGLRNGEYDVYIVTGDSLAAVERAQVASGGTLFAIPQPQPNTRPAGGEIVAAANAPRPEDMAVDIEFLTDRNGDRKCWVDQDITDCAGQLYSLADNLPQEIELKRADVAPDRSESFGLVQGLTPDLDGVIHYGIVRVENNYLALFLRNWARTSVLNRCSRVVLAPRSRTAGRININTAVTRRVAGTNSDEIFNPLLGIPGVLFGLDPTTGQVTGPSTIDPIDLRTAPALGTPLPLPEIATPFGYAPIPMLDRARLITAGRFEWYDGRYYRFPADLVTPQFDIASERNRYPIILSRFADDATRFSESAFRYARMANLVSTRSDVFEIVVTAQAGEVSNRDENGDGRIDFRNDFIINAEKKTRTIYER
ncbi:MAG: hypothetical protein HY706_07080 [Candidatus Hydrogenedentes bacterium]|nr:hypothetical protein [Candidatus Hydrogenedentota bacterium]